MNILDVSQPQFYFPFIIFFTFLYGCVQVLIWLFKRSDDHEYHDLNDEEKLLMKDEEFIKKGQYLKSIYMSAFLLSKASMWAKAPYTYMLFSTLHGFTVGQIGVLYLIDAFCSLFSGPFIGILADTFGRKIIALIYPFNTMIVLLMRMSGNIPLAYFAQFMTGFAALSLSLVLALSSVIVITSFWPENTPNAEYKTTILESFKGGLRLLKQPQIFFLGLVDSFYNCSIQIIVFIWTPVLQETAHSKNINPAMIYLIMILTILINNKSLEFLHKAIRINFFVLASFYLVIYTSTWIVIYFVEDFETRLICLALINGSGGLFNPVLSYLRSIILVEQYRTLLMNLFRIPLNLILIIMLLLANYFQPFEICLFVGILLIIPFFASLYLLFYHYRSIKLDKEICELEAREDQTPLVKF